MERRMSKFASMRPFYQSGGSRSISAYSKLQETRSTAVENQDGITTQHW
jgi:hypothetical protein